VRRAARSRSLSFYERGLKLDESGSWPDAVCSRGAPEPLFQRRSNPKLEPRRNVERKVSHEERTPYEKQVFRAIGAISDASVARRSAGQALRGEPPRSARTCALSRNMKKQLPFALVVFVTGFYTTFVLKNLWNWFLAPALHTPGVSYWMMYGIQLIWDLLSVRKWNSPLEQQKWDGLFTVLDGCLPDEKRTQVEEALQGREKTLWADLQRKVFGDLISQTVALAIGWGVHLFLT